MSDIKDSYVYVESKSQDQTCIGIKGGKFAGVIYKYGKVSLGEDWINLIGDILVNIMDEEYGKSDNRENDII